MNMDHIEHRYLNDAVFHNLVERIRHSELDEQTVLDAVQLAFKMGRPRHERRKAMEVQILNPLLRKWAEKMEVDLSPDKVRWDWRDGAH